MQPRICVIGPMVGFHEGRVKTQGQILSMSLAKDGYHVSAASSILNRYARLIDKLGTVILRSPRIDLAIVEVYSGRSFAVTDLVTLVARIFGLRIILWLHGGALPEFWSKYPRWTRRVLSRADKIIAPSKYLARAAADHGFKAMIIPNSLDLSDYPYRHRDKVKPRLFWMRSFQSIWNPLMAVRVLARLREIEPEASLVMAGQDKGLEEETIQLAQQLGLTGSIRFPGFLNNVKKGSEGNAADIYINTNRIDNMPVAVLEACAMGLPVITTDVGGIKDLLTEGETALLVPDNDCEAMVQAIKQLIDDPSLAGSLSLNGRRLAEQSSWKLVRPQWETVFSELTTIDAAKDVSRRRFSFLGAKK